MKFLTSFGFSRIERQQICVRSWLKVGAEITAVQSAGESERLQQHFPGVRFVETDLVGDLFDKPHMPRIAAFFPEVTEPALLINSDIEVRCMKPQFDQWWAPVDGTLKVGIRWDHNQSKLRFLPQKWGIDAFLLLPEFASQIPDIGMTIGVPCWDYWLPWHCVMNLGLSVTAIKQKCLLHLMHKQNWSKEEHKRAMDVFEPIAGISGEQMDRIIQKWTGRLSWRNR